MQFDLTSDLHLEFPIKVDNPTPKQSRMLSRLLSYIVPSKPSPTLVVAGDISNSNSQTILFLDAVSKIYTDVIVVLGNHDYWVFDNRGSHTRINALINAISLMPNVKLLHNGDNVYTDSQGIRFAGASVLYDNSLAKSMYGMDDILIRKLWINTMNDCKYLRDLDYLNETRKGKLELYESLSSKPHVIVTHVAPTNWHMKFNTRTQSPSDTFYCFDGHGLLEVLDENTVWCFGHTHDLVDCVLPNNVRLIANALDYITTNGWYMNGLGIDPKRKFKTVNVD